MTDATAYVATATGSSAARTLGSRAADVYHASDFGLVDNGSTDNASALQSAISGLTAGTIVFDGGGSYAIASTITLKSQVVLRLGPGTTIKWTGASNGTMFNTTSNVATWYAGVIGELGSVIDPNSLAGTVFDLHSVSASEFGGFNLGNGSSTTVCFKLIAENSNNNAFNYFHDVTAWVLGTLVSLSGAGSTTGVVTLNTFERLRANYADVCGISFVQWCDNNMFRDVRVSLNANNSAGVIFNSSGTSSSEMGVYANNFDNLAVDAFSGKTGRSGIVFNNCKDIYISNYFQSPTAEAKSIVDNYGNSYWIMQIGIAGSYAMNVYTKNVTMNATLP